LSLLEDLFNVGNGVRSGIQDVPSLIGSVLTGDVHGMATEGRKLIGDVGDVLDGVSDLGVTMTKVSSRYAGSIGKLADSQILAAAQLAIEFEEPGHAPEDTLLIGKRLFVRDYSDGVAIRWHQFDLQNGEQGKTCDHKMGTYLGTDGAVALFGDGNANIGLVTKARDLTTCDMLWTITSPTGSFREVWRVNTTLVQLSADGTELMSLVAPG
jgi:hypothetical protein